MKLGVESGEVFVSAGARRRASRRARRSTSPPASRALRRRARSCSATASTAWSAARVRAPSRWHRTRQTAGVAAARAGRRRLGDRPLVREPVRGTASASSRRCGPPSPARASERACRAVTVVGPGRDRQVAARAGAVAAVGDDATVVVGRCPSYGEGVTYRPLAEIVGQLGGSDPRPGRRAARRRRGGRADGAGRGRPVRRRGPGRGDVLGRPPAARARGAGAPARGGRRGRPLGRADAARPARVPRGVLERARRSCSSASRGPSCWRRAPAWVAPQPNRSLLVLDALSDAEARRARRERRRRRARDRHGGADRGDGRGQPAVPRAARGGGRGERRGRAPVEHPGGARRAHRPARARASARCSSTPRSRAAASTSARWRSCCRSPRAPGSRPTWSRSSTSS